VLPEGVSGNFYRSEVTHDRRWQAIANLYLPAQQWLGRHEFRIGADFTDLHREDQAHRAPTLVLREDGTLSRRITFVDAAPFDRSNLESSAYAQDRWSPAERLVIEAGLRFDSDQIIRDLLVSPRLSGTYTLPWHGDTKFSAGLGYFYDATRLAVITRPLQGQRLDEFFDPTGTVLTQPIATTRFLANETALHAPRFQNWSVGIERRLPFAILTNVEYLQRRGKDGLAYANAAADAGAPGGIFMLTNQRRDSYDGLQITARRDFKNNYAVLVAYTHSNARTNRALDATLDNPIFGPQAGGPLPWDTPNRVISWGWAPVPWFKRLDFAYSLEFHTGFAYSLVNQNQQLFGLPNQARFPSYLSFNPALEKRFYFLGREWALRGGIDNITGRLNPQFVNNNVDSPEFGQFSGTAHRTFNGRIRLLGRKK